ncbi:hypothetical protein [Trinickia sp. EG282A]|uniref:hypothetical protein n=1 Tax=Trinickia sp. EG282A TaxID=3237013 RepID=UPI0034D34186
MKLDRAAFALRSIAFALASGILGGCMTSTPIWDKHFGEAARAVAQAQIIDPNAGEHNPSRPGVDGRAAVSAVDAYNKSFETPPPAVTQFFIGGQ